MRKKLFAVAGMLLCGFFGKAQLIESFDDGDFTNNPTWAGGTADWIVNGSFQLQSNNTVANSTYYLSTASTKATTAQWDFFAQLNFNPSSVNYMDIYLTASGSDLTQPSTTGYFVRLGGTDDEVSLFRKDNGTATKIIDGANAVLNSSVNALQVRVIRDASNQWSLSRNLNGSGFFSEGLVTDANYLTSSFFGVLVKQSTASFFQKHFLDDIRVSDFVPDIVPPVIDTVYATGVNTADVLFDEPVDPISSQVAANYSVNNGVGGAITATRDGLNPALVHLSFATNFPPRINLQITITGVSDLAANTLNNGTYSFLYFVPGQYDIVIDELMADPDPQVGLPNVEWLELKNVSGFDINLLNWKLGKPSGESGPLPAYTLKADSFVIICTGSAVAALTAFGPTRSVTSFPSLGNSGDLLYLRAPDGSIIHSLNYTDAWYQNELKKSGGWSLEMIDTHNPCSGMSNWKASTDPAGGTPGRKNSVDGNNPDQQAPKLLRAYATDSVNITLVFDESINTVSGAVNTNFSISDGIGSPVTATPVGPVFDHINLQLATAISRNKIYTITASNLGDCVGNTIGTTNKARVGLAEHIDSFDIVVNEILFNPKPTSNDWVEIYNRSNKILDLKNLYIANRNSTGIISSIEQLSLENYQFFPGDFIVITESKDLVLHDYTANDLNAFIEVGTMPSFNDDEGNAIILNEQGNIVDEVAYLDNWHFPLVSNEEGVSLERIDYNAPSKNAGNWHSAATSVGYGTPTYKNSQARGEAAVKGEITVDPEVFSPDNDGHDDFALISYRFPEPGYVANITIFDAVGRPVKNLQRNALNGIKGSYRWDGLNDKNQKLPVGIYVVYTEVFNLQGKTKKFKNSIVLARKQ